jgi:hypothetical protein
MAAAAGASGARSWLQTQTWLTRRVLKGITIAMFVVAFGFSSLMISGSAAPKHAVSTTAIAAHSGSGGQ